jgi:uncharacterized membrane protein YedE/YeeE
MRNLLCFIVGLLFGVGLCVSGMTHPDKVLGFLDLAGSWDPSLAFVMAGAVLVASVAFSLAKRRLRDLFGAPLALPDALAIDWPLVAGSLIFGIGWGLVGVCPGPGIVDIGFLERKALVFVAAMAIGMVIHKFADLRAPAQRALEEDA